MDECYKSSVRILNTIDVFDDIVHLQNSWESLPLVETNHAYGHTNTQSLLLISEEFRRSLKPMLASLRSLSENWVKISQREQQKVLKTAYKSAMNLLDNLKLFEANQKVN
jgi:subfamily B ATP-binding cassette protein MsbA